MGEKSSVDGAGLRLAIECFAPKLVKQIPKPLVLEVLGEYPKEDVRDGNHIGGWKIEFLRVAILAAAAHNEGGVVGAEVEMGWGVCVFHLG